MLKVTNGKTFSKILLPIHDSIKSHDNALDCAIKIAQDYDARLIILYIIRASADKDASSPPDYIIQLKREAQKYLLEISQKVNKNKDNILRVNTKIVASIKIADAIISYAEDKQMDLIVIGTLGRSKLKGLILGSIATEVVRHANCPVLTVRQSGDNRFRS